MREMAGKVAVVTGGARGLGDAICRMLAEEGCDVVSADKLHSRAAGDPARPGVTTLPLDVRDAGAVAAGLRQVADERGGLDILVNDAAVDVTKPIDELSQAEFDAVLAVNLRAPFAASKAAFPLMRARGGGDIVNIASTASKRCWANACAYHATKWGLLGLSHSLHAEGRGDNIKVSAIVSGGMRTPFLLERFPDIPLATLQDPENVAAAVRFVLTQPEECCVPELMVMPRTETSWP
ncbi:MAG: SDR family oxidoreductase [Coriobacteriia bacterium]|nr:SDR family oxidoreductase [Coriobacteriia bacterium]